MERHDAPGQPITSGQQTWLVIHGNDSSRDAPYIVQLANAIDTQSGTGQVITLDWSSISTGLGTHAHNIALIEDYIPGVADWAASVLESEGFAGSELNIVGHSFGANIAAEIGDRISGGVNTLVGLDPAEDVPLNSYNPNTEVDFGSASSYSWSFYSEAGEGIVGWLGYNYGNEETPTTADEAFTVLESSHTNVVTLFSNIISGVGSTSVTQHFALSRLLGATPGPWLLDQYDDNGNEDPSGLYDAVIQADAAGTEASSIVYIPPVPPDSNDQISEAQMVSIGNTINGSISPDATDVDMYGLTVSPGQTVGFDIDRPSGSLDSYLRLFNGAGIELDDSDDDAGPSPEYTSLESYIEYTFAMPGTYYLGVSTLDNDSYDPVTGGWDTGGGATGGYDLTLTDETRVDLQVPYYSQGSAAWCWAAATSMLIGYYGYDRMPWEVASDENASPLDGRSHSDVEEYLEDGFDFGETNAWVIEDVGTYDAFQNVVVDNLNAGKPSYVSIDAETHAVVVTGYDGLDVDDHVFINDPDRSSGNHEDLLWVDLFYRLDMPDHHAQLIYARNSHAATDERATLSILGTDSQGAASLWFDNNFGGQAHALKLYWDGSAPHPGYCYVDSPSGFYMSDSVLGFSATALDTLHYTPQIATTGGALSLSIQESLFKDVGGTWTLVAPPQQSSLAPFAAYTNALQDDSWVPDLALTSLDNGSYRLYLSLRDDGDFVHETCSILFSVNGQLSTEVTIGLANSTAGEPDDNGSYRIMRTGSTTSSLDVNFSMSGGAGRNVDYELVGGSVSGNTLTIPSGAPEVVVTLQVIEDGEDEPTEPATMTLTGGSGYTVGAADDATLNILDDDIPDSNDQISEATLLSVGSSTSAAISPDKDVDMYKFTVSAGQTVGFDIDRTSGSLDSYIRLFNGSANELDENDDGTGPTPEPSGADSYLEYTFATPGTYYLGVSTLDNDSYDPVTGGWDTGGGATGGYDLTLKVLEMLDPTVTGLLVNDTLLSDADVGSGRFEVTVTYDEPMKASPAPTITFSPSVSSTLTFSSGTWTDSTHYDATYHVADAGVTVSGIGVNVSGAKDLADNIQTPYNVSSIFSIDTQNPTVTINQASGQADPTNNSPISFTVIFNDTVSDFASGDVTLSGTAGATTDVVSGSGMTYNVTVSGMTVNGTVMAGLAAGVAHDAAGNASNASSSTDKKVTYNGADVIPPTVTGAIVNDGMVQRTKIITLAASFSEAVVCAAGAMTLTNNTTSEQFDLSGVPFDLASGTWDLSGVVLTNGYYTASISAGAVEDLAGNPMSADYEFTFHCLAGDTTGDASVAAMDYITLKRRMGTVGGVAWDGGDLDGDGDVDWSDLQAMMENFGVSLGASPAAAPAAGQELLASPPANAPDADVLAVAASAFGNRFTAGRHDVPLAAARPANSLRPVHVAGRVGPLSISTSSPSRLLRNDSADPVVSDVLTLARPWWPDDPATRELPDEALMTSLDTGLAGKPRKGWLDRVDLDILAASR